MIGADQIQARAALPKCFQYGTSRSVKTKNIITYETTSLSSNFIQPQNKISLLIPREPLTFIVNQRLKLDFRMILNSATATADTAGNLIYNTRFRFDPNSSSLFDKFELESGNFKENNEYVSRVTAALNATYKPKPSITCSTPLIDNIWIPGMAHALEKMQYNGGIGSSYNIIPKTISKGCISIYQEPTIDDVPKGTGMLFMEQDLNAGILTARTFPCVIGDQRECFYGQDYTKLKDGLDLKLGTYYAVRAKLPSFVCGELSDTPYLPLGNLDNSGLKVTFTMDYANSSFVQTKADVSTTKMFSNRKATGNVGQSTQGYEDPMDCSSTISQKTWDENLTSYYQYSLVSINHWPVDIYTIGGLDKYTNPSTFTDPTCSVYTFSGETASHTSLTCSYTIINDLTYMIDQFVLSITKVAIIDDQILNYYQAAYSFGQALPKLPLTIRRYMITTLTLTATQGQLTVPLECQRFVGGFLQFTRPTDINSIQDYTCTNSYGGIYDIQFQIGDVDLPKQKIVVGARPGEFQDMFYSYPVGNDKYNNAMVTIAKNEVPEYISSVSATNVTDGDSVFFARNGGGDQNDRFNVPVDNYHYSREHSLWWFQSSEPSVSDNGYMVSESYIGQNSLKVTYSMAAFPSNITSLTCFVVLFYLDNIYL